MGKLSRKDFAELTGINDKHIPTYAKRGKLFIGEDGSIDDKHPLNKAFIFLKKTTVNEKPVKKVVKRKASNDAEKVTVVEPDDSEYLDRINANKAKLDLEIKIKEEDLIKRKLENEKKRGETMPTEFVKDLIRGYGSATRKAYKDSTETIILLIGHESKLTNEQTTKIRKQLNSVLNKAVDEAASIAIKTVDAIVKEYSQTRGVGEK